MTDSLEILKDIKERVLPEVREFVEQRLGVMREEDGVKALDFIWQLENQIKILAVS